MAIAFAQVKYLSRSKALQATAAAAYRSCSKVYDERTGLTFDYTNKSSPLLYSEILLPETADSKFKDRELLWNMVEKIETRRNSQVAKEVVLALPKDEDVTDADKIELARRFAITHFVNKGVAVDLNIHNEEGNPHAHLLITTRKLIGSQFDSHKARDLDPKVINGRVQMDKAWGDEWRHFQNHYFLAKGINLAVDADGICSQVHLGKHVFHSKDREKLDLWQINQERHQEAREIALTDPESVLNQLTLHHSVFSEQDMARLLHKHIDDPNEFQSAFLKVKASRQLISLGLGDDGKERYTMRALFKLENRLQDIADQLKERYLHPVKQLDEKVISQLQLNKEQANAISHILQGADLAIILGRAGTGKTYALKAAKEAFVNEGYHLQGIALSGVAAQNLQEASTISSRTIASFRYALRKETLKLTDRDIIIMDEAGMTDVYALAEVVNAVHQARAKLILIGDDAQLQPIGPGAPFRALLERAGFAELQQIVRQESSWQREATQLFAAGKTKQALALYEVNQGIHFEKTPQETMYSLIDNWHNKCTQGNLTLSQTLILAHRNVDVMQLNGMARAKRILSGEIDQGVLVNQKEEFWLSKNDRILFLKNDSQLGIKNGQLGTVIHVEANNSGITRKITVVLDSNKRVTFNPQEYRYFTHGYATTVHKSQGMTTDHTFIYVSGNYWNHNLMYVAGSRHKKSLDIYVDQLQYMDFSSLVRGVDKDGTKDNIIDYPLNFAKRRGIENESLLERFRQYTLDYLKSARQFVQEKYQQYLHRDKEIANDKLSNQSKEFDQFSAIKFSKENTNEIPQIQIVLKKLQYELLQAKEEKNHYKTYQLKRQLHREMNNLCKNKALYLAIQSKSPKFIKDLQGYLKQEKEYEIE